MANYKEMDMFGELYRQAQDSYDSRLSRARVAAYAIAREKMIPFLRLATTQQEVDLRLDLTETALSELARAAATEHGVEASEVHQHVMERLAAEVAVTKPKTVKPDAPIGGAEGKKYLETRPRKVPEEGQPDDKTDVNELDAVVEEPKRHKFVQDQKLETQKDNKPGSGSGAKGKSFPAHSSVQKEAMPVSRRDFEAIAGILRARGADPGIVSDIADYFATQNERFDRDRFDQAAGPDPTEEFPDQGSRHPQFRV